MAAKFVSYYIEKFSGYIIAAGVTVLAYYFIDFDKIEINDLFFDKLVDFSGILFGFLITVLTILIQTHNTQIERLKKSRLSRPINRHGRALNCHGRALNCHGRALNRLG